MMRHLFDQPINAGSMRLIFLPNRVGKTARQAQPMTKHEIIEVGIELLLAMYVDNSGRLRKSRRQEMDERMCKPGYTWQERSWDKNGGECVPAVDIYRQMRHQYGDQATADRFTAPNTQVGTQQQQQLPTNASAEGRLLKN